ncbi:hypothetical protein ACYOEI_04015 [Singulisphaera rosea]
MPEYIVRLFSPSKIRLGEKPYIDENEGKTVFLDFPFGQIAIFDAWTEMEPGLHVCNGLVLQVRIVEANIDSAIRAAGNLANYALSLLSCVAMASAATALPIMAYDVSENIQDRDFRYCFYETGGPQASRALKDQNLIHVLEKNYNSFLVRTDIKDDFKERVQRALVSFRRGLADNEDVLNEFLTAWSTMEGLDCVYTKLLPSSTVRNFKEGMKDVLGRLGRPTVFDRLERLRNEIAHGSLSLQTASKTADDHIQLIRQAVIMMIMRIIKVDDHIIEQIISQNAYKGKARHHIRLMASITFVPAGVQDVENQPQVKAWLQGKTFVRLEKSLDYQPDVRFQAVNIPKMTLLGVEIWDDAGAPIVIKDIAGEIVRAPGSSNES